MPIKKPLADLIRPKNLSQFVGQTKLISEGKPLYQIIKNHVPISLLLWGPPGTGKTSLAQIIAREYDYPLATFNASIDNKAKLMQIINTYPYQSFVLLIDEIHRMSIVPAVRSRCQIFEFETLDDKDISEVLVRALKEVFHLDEKQIDKEAINIIARSADGDLRVALNLLETIHAVNGEKISAKNVKEFVKGQHFAYDRKATKHYDYLAAYSDSMAGSDTDAALYYLTVLLKNGDLPSVVRRLREIPYTYVGLANPEQVTQIVVAANQAEKIGMPKAKYPLMFATMLMCLSPKSGAFDEIWAKLDKDTIHPNKHPMPRGLRDMHYKHSEEITGGGLIDNPFTQPFQIAKQNYMPKGLEGQRYYFAKDNINEKKLEQQYLKLHKYIYGKEYGE